MKIFILPIAPTPENSSTNPNLPSHFTTPAELTSSGAASSIQTLSEGRLLFTRSSLTSPNDVFILRGLDGFGKGLKDQKSAKFQGQPEQVTHFVKDALKSKDLANGEDFWFKGAEDKDVHGWILKPKGWKAGEKKKFPVLLLIHGGAVISPSQALK